MNAIVNSDVTKDESSISFSDGVMALLTIIGCDLRPEILRDFLVLLETVLFPRPVIKDQK